VRARGGVRYGLQRRGLPGVIVKPAAGKFSAQSYFKLFFVFLSVFVPLW
jgi:hypothetical protein